MKNYSIKITKKKKQKKKKKKLVLDRYTIVIFLNIEEYSI